MSACNIYRQCYPYHYNLFCRFHLQMNKTRITSLYAFLFTLSVWLCDVTFTADRSCTLVGFEITYYPSFKTLHWTKIQYRITYTIMMLTYKSYYHNAPTYLCELISRKESSVNTQLEPIITNLLCHQLVRIVQTLFLNVHSLMLLHAKW